MKISVKYLSSCRQHQQYLFYTWEIFLLEFREKFQINDRGNNTLQHSKLGINANSDKHEKKHNSPDRRERHLVDNICEDYEGESLACWDLKGIQEKITQGEKIVLHWSIIMVCWIMLVKQIIMLLGVTLETRVSVCSKLCAAGGKVLKLYTPD